MTKLWQASCRIDIELQHRLTCGWRGEWRLIDVSSSNRHWLDKCLDAED